MKKGYIFDEIRVYDYNVDATTILARQFNQIEFVLNKSKKRVLGYDVVKSRYQDRKKVIRPHSNLEFLKLLAMIKPEIPVKYMTRQSQLLTFPEKETLYDIHESNIDKVVDVASVGLFSRPYICSDETQKWMVYQFRLSCEDVLKKLDREIEK